ncbi:MAG: hypothetical protein A2X25_09045 [Chloroflexi bacterium GWB2_49_20]|nr:MAG: hypothetical protein A2X25_09045 [Chloroflexi bacterium GWB2_49_20]OGN79421.1 MAG: hypothetical protein A2X26_04980 [Chloroflexi bacterium GWC2_49_37]OGN82810.1 MAG: hypothetical protein A2X27_07715 [Chloroflexi bacterium GWD2_49_16]HCC79709.1 endonuclease [Anaerolineae bacterium]HCM97281.1 endonuclease [Anaerolineae bacterium]
MNSVIDGIARSLDLALEILEKTQPDNLKAAMNMVAFYARIDLPDNLIEYLIEHISICDLNDRILHSLTFAIQAWDHEETPVWANGTLPHTNERRREIIKKLGFNSNHLTVINNKIPRYTDAEIPIVISNNHEPWYNDRQKDITDFYWKDYKSHLEESWDFESIGILDISIDDVISRLSDPTRAEIFPVKGLVMGFVQSGKTSHFSGLITKAADAGYRLIIVLAGTMNILRQQTQRRIDKEIVGIELLDPDEYGTDADWKNFVSHGGRPSYIGSFDWERLTDKHDDYQPLSKHLSILEFKPADRTKPFNHPDNLRTASAKLAVIKKVPSRINKLCRDLKRLSELRSALMHVPTLIIDDESDQASVNTIDQSKPGKEGKRTSTNKAIGELLKMLPRAQYVGYTATPFANVFINPYDADDLFPKDFIISLPRPKGYMGVSDFFDFENEFEKGDFRGNYNAFVRAVEGDNEDPENLPMAIDSFVLSGAIKLFRESKDPERFKYFKHHTMLVHHSSKRIVHEEDRDVVENIFNGGVRYQRPAGLSELHRLFENDFVPVSKIRAPDFPFPKNFEELLPFISRCISKICAGKPVLVVNGDDKHRDDTPEFEQTSVWAILVGGAKLSRGYTVEGLTISYYRRPTGAGDTLMQMGRWFGFRNGYKDLVRLFIGSREPKGRTTVDLYEAFGAVCRDEESLRSELQKYSKGGLLPRQVPPLVRQHLPLLPLTSRNKMFNAEICSRDFAGEWKEKTSAPSQINPIKRNQAITATLLSSCQISPLLKISHTNTDSNSKRQYDAMIGLVSGENVLTFLKEYSWADGKKSNYLEIEYIDMMLKKNKLNKWLVLLPQSNTERKFTPPNTQLKDLSVVTRKRVSTSRFKVYSEPRHREAAIYLSGCGNVQYPCLSLLEYRDPEAPVLLLYFVQEDATSKTEITVGFGIQYPGQKVEKAIIWTVKDPDDEDAVVIQQET